MMKPNPRLLYKDRIDSGHCNILRLITDYITTDLIAVQSSEYSRHESEMLDTNLAMTFYVFELPITLTGLIKITDLIL